MKKLSLLLIVLYLFIYSSFSFAQIHYVANNGSPDGNGSLTNPFNKISMAYAAAVSNGQNEVIKLMPGNYYEITNLVFDYENISVRGNGDGTIIQDSIIVKSDMSFADMYIQGSFSNEAFVVFNNVKCADNNIDVESISGTWRDNGDIVHVNYLADPQHIFEAVNLDSMNAYVQGSLTTFIDEAELTDQDWVENHVSNYVSENALLVKDGVIDLSGNIISNFGELFLHNDNCIATGVVHSSMSTYFDTHISCRPPAGVILQYVKFISGSWNGRIFKISTYGTPSWCGSAYYYYNIVTNGYVYIPSGLEFEIYGTDIAISEKFVDQAGDTMAGPLSINEIKMYSTTENGYLVTGCSHEDANGIYYQEGYYWNGGAQAYKNLNSIYMFRYYWTDGGESGYYWAFSDSLQDNITGPFPTPCYDYSTSSSSTPPEEWNQSTVIGPTHQRAPVIDFAGGKGINLAQGTATNDIVNKGYVDSQFLLISNSTVNQAEIKIISATNSIINTITQHYVSKSGGTVSNLTVNGSIIAEEILLTNCQNWFVGALDTPGYIVIDNTNSAITTPETSYAPLRLITHNYKPVIIESGRLHIGPTLHPNGDEGGEIQLAADPDVGFRVIIDVINNNLRFYAVDENNGNIRMYTLWKLNPTESALGQAVWTNGQWEVASDFVPNTTNVYFNPSYSLSTNLQSRIDQLETAVEELQNQ